MKRVALIARFIIFSIANEPAEQRREAGEAAALYSHAKVLCRRKKSRVICKVRFLRFQWRSENCNRPIAARRDCDVKAAWFWSPLFCSHHTLSSSVIYYWIDALQHGIYLLNSHNNLRHSSCLGYLTTKKYRAQNMTLCRKITNY